MELLKSKIVSSFFYSNGKICIIWQFAGCLYRGEVGALMNGIVKVEYTSPLYTTFQEVYKELTTYISELEKVSK